MASESALSEKQQAYVHGAVRRWNVKAGAVRSGKTFVDVAHVLPERVMNAGGGGLILLMGNTQETIRRNVVEPMRRIWGPLVGDIHPASGHLRLFGRTAYVLGADNAARVKALQGTSLSYCYGDEVTTWSREVFEMLKSRLDQPGSLFDGTCNPAGPNHWFKAFLDSGADIFQQHYVLDDNPFLPADFVAALKSEYAGTVYYDRYVLGQWTLAEGLVYPGFARARHVVAEAPAPARVRFACDVGHANATAFLAVGEGADGRFCVLDEYYHSGQERGEARSPLAYARDFVAFRDRVMARWPAARYAGVYVDPSALGFMTQLRDEGVYSVYKARNAVLEGIAGVASLLDAGRLVVCARCRRLVEEFSGYVWDAGAAARGEDRPVKAADHALDALRYALCGLRTAKRG